jgi:hypothetical protein
MFGTFKIIAVTAALSAGVVTAYDHPQLRGEGQPGSKTFYDRVPPSESAPMARLAPFVVPGEADGRMGAKGDALTAGAKSCAAQAWPNISPDCLVAESGATLRASVRTITIEQREGTNTSVLVRMPAEIASR